MLTVAVSHPFAKNAKGWGTRLAPPERFWGLTKGGD